MMKHVALSSLLLLAMVFMAPAVLVDAGESGSNAGARFGRVTFIEGRATTTPLAGGTAQALATRSLIRPGQQIRTEADARLEITFLDGTIVRLGPSSEYDVESVDYSAPSSQRFEAKLTRGRMWARVAPFSARRFQVRTPVALVSVRGTTYDLLAAADESTEVSVYDGRVGVEPPPIEEGAAHEEISWPVEVTEAEWEEIILGKLQRLRIGPDGRPQDPVAFQPETGRDEWVDWNLERDSGA